MPFVGLKQQALAELSPIEETARPEPQVYDDESFHACSAFAGVMVAVCISFVIWAAIGTFIFLL